MSQHSKKHTFTYKISQPGDIQHQLDLHLPDETKFGMVAFMAQQIMKGVSAAQDASHALPLIVYWHGGGLVGGNRDVNDWFPRWLLEDALNAGFAVISADYTLLSPCNGYDILQDVKDLFTFIAEEVNIELSKLSLSSQSIDTSRIAVAGSSAGGYLTYLSAVHAIPKPKAIAPIYAMLGDATIDFYYSKNKSAFFGPDYDPNDPAMIALLKGFPSTTPRAVRTPTDSARLGFYPWLLHSAQFLDVFTGDTDLTSRLESLSAKDREAAFPEKTLPLFPQFSVTKESWPPTFFVHGTLDSAVLVDESRNMAKRLEAEGIIHSILEVEDGEHGFDIGKNHSSAVKGLEQVVPFLLKHV